MTMMLLDMNIVTKNGNYRPPIIGINKDYDFWKELPKMVTTNKIKGSQRVASKVVNKNGNSSYQKRQLKKKPTYYSKKEKEELSFSLYEFYKNEISPRNKSSQRAKKNIAYHLDKHTFENLEKAVKNYSSILNGNDPQYRKDPANFFGWNKKDQYFIDFLPENFEPPETEPENEGEWSESLRA